jgi:hypothetical protein
MNPLKSKRPHRVKENALQFSTPAGEAVGFQKKKGKENSLEVEHLSWCLSTVQPTYTSDGTVPSFPLL